MDETPDLGVVDTSGGDEVATSAYVNADARSGTIGGKPNYSIDQAANQIIRGQPGWSGTLGKAANVTYAYRSDAPAQIPEGASGFSRFTAAQIHQAELALAGWSDVANISFTRVGSGDSGDGVYSNDATILFSDYSSGQAGVAAFTSYPGSTRSSSQAGDVWINISSANNQNPTTGNYGGMVLVHEIGHAIGLAHPSDYDVTDGSNITYAANAAYYEDSRQYTVMSYFSEANTGGRDGGFYAAAPLLDDIAAVQLEYGANMTTRTGDTVYGFGSNADRPWFLATTSSSRLVFAVWDAGGNDTFDFSGYSTSQLVDLRQGFFSDVGGLVGNVAVAQGTDIENARSGSGADTINGNELANSVFGGAGDDSITGNGGQDYLRGEAGNDRIVGGAGFDDINGNTGNDTENGGLDGDWVVGGQDSDLLYGEDGDDIVYGNLGNDTCDGGAGNDIVRGGQGDDSVAAGAGDDFVSGDRGNDTVSGGAGADTFNTFSGAGVDRVVDFSAAEGDRVRVESAAYAVRQSGADTVVDLGNGDMMVLVGVDSTTLPGGWIFVV